MRGTFGLLQAEYKRPESGDLEQQIMKDAVGVQQIAAEVIRYNELLGTG